MILGEEGSSREVKDDDDGNEGEVDMTERELEVAAEAIGTHAG